MMLATASPATAAPAKLKLATKPVVASAGTTVTVTGRIVGPRGSRRDVRVLLEERRGRWIRRAAAKPTRKLRFAVRWRAPKVPGKRTLRLRMVKGKRTLATTGRWTLTIAAPAPLASGPATPTPVADPSPPAPVAHGTEPASRPPQTHAIAPQTVIAAPAPGTAGTLRLDSAVPLQPGDVLAAGVSQAAPYGFLLKATTVRPDGAQTVADVVPATLLEALPQGRIDESFILEPAPVSGRRGGRSGGIRFRKTAQCTAGGTVDIAGEADLGTPQIEIDADWGILSLNSVEATASVTASAHASASASGAASCSVGPIEIVDTKLGTITFFVGSIPVVLVPELEIDLEGFGTVEAAVSTSVDASLTATAGARYEDGDLSPIAELDESFSHVPPNPTGSATLEATLSSELEIAAYGAGGPAFTFDAGLEMNADPADEPWWTLDAPVALTAGLEIDVLDVEAGPITVFEDRFRLAEAAPRAPMYRIVDGEARYAVGFDAACANPDRYPCGSFSGGWVSPERTVTGSDDVVLSVHAPSPFGFDERDLEARSAIEPWAHGYTDVTEYSSSPCGGALTRTEQDVDTVLPPPGADNGIDLAVRIDPPAAGQPVTKPQVKLGGTVGLRLRSTQQPVMTTRRARTTPSNPTCNGDGEGPMGLHSYSSFGGDPTLPGLLDFANSVQRTPFSVPPVYGQPRCAAGRCVVRVSGVNGYDDVYGSVHINGTQRQRINWWYDVETCFAGCTGE
jgi:hypothetical protein